MIVSFENKNVVKDLGIFYYIIILTTIIKYSNIQRHQGHVFLVPIYYIVYVGS